MDTLSLVLLGVIAAASLAQALSLVAVAMAGRGIARRVGRFEQSLEREIQPALREAARLTHGLAEVSEVTAAQADRLSDVLDTAASTIARTGTVLTEALLPSAARVAAAVSVSRSALELLSLCRRRFR
jgi:ABC-type uncharacterized transport system YnjBCD permease subunit